MPGPSALQGEAALVIARAAIVACERCPRLLAYCSAIRETRRKAYHPSLRNSNTGRLNAVMFEQVFVRARALASK